MDRPRDAVRVIRAAYRQGDIDGVLARLAPDVLRDHNGQRDLPEAVRPRRGREAVRGFLRHLGTVEFLRFEPQGFLSEGSMVAVPIEVGITLARAWRRDPRPRDPPLDLWPRRLAPRHRAFVDSHAMAAFERGRAGGGPPIPAPPRDPRGSQPARRC